MKKLIALFAVLLSCAAHASITTNNLIRTIYPQPNGNIIISGEFTQVNGQPRIGLAQLDSQLNLLKTKAHINGEVNSVLQYEDQIIVGGKFDVVGDFTPIAPFVKLDKSGHLLASIDGLSDPLLRRLNKVDGANSDEKGGYYLWGSFTLKDGQSTEFIHVDQNLKILSTVNPLPAKHEYLDSVSSDDQIAVVHYLSTYYGGVKDQYIISIFDAKDLSLKQTHTYTQTQLGARDLFSYNGQWLLIGKIDSVDGVPTSGFVLLLANGQAQNIEIPGLPKIYYPRLQLIGNKIIIHDEYTKGGSVDGPAQILYVIDLATRTYHEPKIPASFIRNYNRKLHSRTHNGEFYFFVNDSNPGYQDEVWTFDPATDVYKLQASFEVSNSYYNTHFFVTDDNFIIQGLAGKADTRTAHNTLYFDRKSNTFKNQPELNNSIDFLDSTSTGVFVGGDFNTLGGEAANNFAVFNAKTLEPIKNVDVLRMSQYSITRLNLFGNQLLVTGYSSSSQTTQVFDLKTWAENYITGYDKQVATDVSFSGNQMFSSFYSNWNGSCILGQVDITVQYASSKCLISGVEKDSLHKLLFADSKLFSLNYETYDNSYERTVTARNPQDPTQILWSQKLARYAAFRPWANLDFLNGILYITGSGNTFSAFQTKDGVKKVWRANDTSISSLAIIKNKLLLSRETGNKQYELVWDKPL